MPRHDWIRVAAAGSLGLLATLCSPLVTNSHAAEPPPYEGPGGSIVNAAIEGVERGLDLSCEDEKLDHLTFYFYGVPHRVERRIHCRDSKGNEQVLIRVIGSDSITRHWQKFGHLKIEYLKGANCPDCVLR